MMWTEFPEHEKQEYKRMILAFASLTEMFAQKAENGENYTIPSPIINSKYQETIFQRVFHASAEDIGNTSYDASVNLTGTDGAEHKYLIGIKTFGIGSGAQKVAQFKANHDEWSGLINQMRANAVSDGGTAKTKEEINKINALLYLELARKIATLRNARIRSSEANIQGFSVSSEHDDVQAVYHVLMPSPKGEAAAIYVGETSYDQINVGEISVIGCTSARNPTNFDFTDGNHTYRFTSADSRLLMDFGNKQIVQEKWDVVYADDAYGLFSGLADRIYGTRAPVISESYSWLITNEDGEVERFSGFNSFYGTGSKLAVDQRERRISDLAVKYSDVMDENYLKQITEKLRSYLLVKASSKAEKEAKAVLRREISARVREAGNPEFTASVEKLIYRPKDELYIPIPNAKEFHASHPDFFGPGIGTFRERTNKLALEKSRCEFNLVFEPSGDSIRSFITQDNGKAIESVEKQSYLGEWILRGVFQLDEFEPLTAERLREIGINGIRLYKIEGDPDVHLRFIWIDKKNLPKDFMKYHIGRS